MLFIFSFSEPETIRYKYRSNVSCSYYLKALARRFCKIFTSRTSRQKRENGATQRENTLIITPHRSSPLSPSRIRCERQEREREIFFNSRSRTQVGVANECEFYIVDPRARAVFTKESTLSRYFHGAACENVNFILPPYRQILYAISVRFLDGIEYALTARGADRADKSARMLAISKELLHGSYGVIRMEICINRRCIPNSRRKRDI